mgnify:CR=1 FL=1
MSYALIADLGGTNARFALASIGDTQIQKIKVLPCKEYDTLFLALTEYLSQVNVSISSISAVVLAIAGPVNQPLIRFSNNNWQFTRADLAGYFGADKKLALLNDFDAIGHSLDVLGRDELVAIGDGVVEADQPAWVVGAGTGLGVACVIPQADISYVLPGEGGHVDLTSCTEQEDYILSYLRERHHRVSAERVLSGMGMENIYAALAHKEGKEQRLSAPQIGEAFKAKEPLAVACMEQFFVYLGRVIGDLILNVESRGGVYIAGGIIPRYLEAFMESGFRQALEEKGRMRHLVSAIPTFVVTAEHPGLIGCAKYASYLVESAK